jgi:hypothetical protein
MSKARLVFVISLAAASVVLVAFGMAYPRAYLSLYTSVVPRVVIQHSSTALTLIFTFLIVMATVNLVRIRLRRAKK